MYSLLVIHLILYVEYRLCRCYIERENVACRQLNFKEHWRPTSLPMFNCGFYENFYENSGAGELEDDPRRMGRQ
eukprot:XP_001705939.1 Hypothetical protein GL50803_8844 [Giardia lamblia ATCC 50803]